MSKRKTVSVNFDNRHVIKECCFKDVNEGEIVGLRFTIQDLTYFHYAERTINQKIAPAIKMVRDKGATPLLIFPVPKEDIPYSLSSSILLVAKDQFGVEIVLMEEW